MTNPEIKFSLPIEFDSADLAALGEGEVAYVKAMSSDEVRRVFPQAPSRDAAVANAWAQDLETVSVH